MRRLDDLLAEGKIVAVPVPLDAGELADRELFAMPRAWKWLREKLPTLQTDGFHEGASSPLQQAYDLFKAFILGEDLRVVSGAPGAVLRPKLMKPPEDGIWEFRTYDLRVFGWFLARGRFVISAVDTAKSCKKHNLYHGYKRQAIEDIKATRLPYMMGGYDECF